MKAKERYAELLRQHAQGDLPDTVLDQMDTLWFEMTEDERDLMRLLSAQLSQEPRANPN